MYGTIQSVAVTGRAAFVKWDCLIGVHFCEGVVKSGGAVSVVIVLCGWWWSVVASLGVGYIRVHTVRPSRPTGRHNCKIFWAVCSREQRRVAGVGLGVCRDCKRC